MRLPASTLIVLSALLLGGCNTLSGAKLLAPGCFDLVAVNDQLYVEAQADAPTRQSLLRAIERAEWQMRAAYGELRSRPIIHACISAACLARFGGAGNFAKVYGNRILLSARGANWHFIAHEWSHAEMWARLDWTAWRQLPQWFDEGLAVALSEAPEHAESHWQYLNATGFPLPTRAELDAMRSRRQWLEAGARYSDGRNDERRARGEPEVHAQYAAAGHAVRPWLARAGQPGLLDLIARLNAGQPWEAVGVAENIFSGNAESFLPERASWSVSAQEIDAAPQR
jgi:hypothetical protein